LPKSAVIAVKEPYFKATVDGGVMVRVDHPSDAVLLEPHDSSVPPQWQTSPKATMTGSQLKEVGNSAFKQGDWQEARKLYSEALTKTDNNTDLRLHLLRNRAQVHLNLGQYEFASEDAIAAVIAGDNISHQAKTSNVKSYFHASRAQYQLGNFSLANEYLEQALGPFPTKKSCHGSIGAY
jgi:tetratricopeptide (TPR) repeat protein